jgi:hypothetical protein
MKEINDLERSVWELIKHSTETKDLKMLGRLNPIAQDIDRVKKEIEKIKQTINSVERGEKGEVDKQMVLVEITDGAIRQNYFSITKPLKAGLIPTDRSEFEVETSTGKTFTTDITMGRLRERGEIAEFYKRENIKPGDKVVWREIVPFKSYHLSKK